MASASVAALAAPDSGTNDTFLKETVIFVAMFFVLGWVSEQLGSATVLGYLVWLPLLIKYVCLSPVHIGARVLMVFALILEPPDELAGGGYWTPPFQAPSLVFFGQMFKWTLIPGLSISLYNVLCIVLYWRARRAPNPVPLLPQVRKVLFIWLGGIFALVAWGAFKGGDTRQAFWQVIHPVSMGLAALAFVQALRGPRDFRAIGTIVTVAAVTKGALVMWVYEIICRPLNVKPAYATTHSDSLTFAFAIIVVAVNWFEHRDKPSMRLLLSIVPFVILAIVMNNRRLAFVGIGAGVFTTFAVLRSSPLKKKIIRWALLLSPVFYGYVKVGGNSSNPIFGPAVLINSVTSGEDSSSITREIENYNLINTLKQGRIMGPGFGHEYIEYVQADDISAGFPQYRYIPHNSVLAMWAFGGLIGFCSLWMIYPMLAYFAARGYKQGATFMERAAGLGTLAGSTAVMAQTWGDMGFCSGTIAAGCAICYAVAGRLCSTTEARQIAAATTSQPHISAAPSAT